MEWLVGLILLLVLAGTAMTMKEALRVGIKVPEFTTLIRRVLLDRDVAKAIRLASTSTAPLARATHALLLRNNRPHSLELVYQEGLLILSRGERKSDYIMFFSNLFGFLSYTVLLLVIAKMTNFSDLSCVMVGLVWVCDVTVRSLYAHIKKTLFLSVQALTEIRNALYAKAEYVPPQYDPRPMTAEEIMYQKLSMEAFEIDIQDRKESGEPVDVAKEFAAKTNGTGLLPPL